MPFRLTLNMTGGPIRRLTAAVDGAALQGAEVYRNARASSPVLALVG